MLYYVWIIIFFSVEFVFAKYYIHQIKLESILFFLNNKINFFVIDCDFCENVNMKQ